MDRDGLITELIQLATACCTGKASDDQRARLERLLDDDPDARAIYLRIADDTVTLNDVKSARQVTAQCSASRWPPLSAAWAKSRLPVIVGSAIAASVLAVAAWRLSGLSSRETKTNLASVADSSAGRSAFARIVFIADVAWSEDGSVYREWDRLGPGDALKFDAGSVEILYDNGVQFVVQGPADCTFTAEKRLTARAGKLVARVSPDALGFQIVTPHMAVIDRGTSFGLTIEPDRQTDVVVYEGKVDLAIGASGGDAGRRLEAGEALRVGRDGRLRRISSVASDAFLPPPHLADASLGLSRLIRSVADNLKSTQTAKYYRVVAHGFREDCQAYVDRKHHWNGLDDRGIPPFLDRADYVMTFNDDKVNADLQMAVTLAQPARLYILFDDRAKPPQWLTESFVDTGWDIGIDEGYDDVENVKTAIGAGRSIEHTFSIWAKDVDAASTVLLGSLREVKTQSHPRDVELAMYGIAATPLANRSWSAGRQAGVDANGASKNE